MPRIRFVLYDGLEEMLVRDLDFDRVSDLEIECAMKGVLASAALTPEETFDAFFGQRTDLTISKQPGQRSGERLLSCGSNPHIVVKISGE